MNDRAIELAQVMRANSSIHLLFTGTRFCANDLAVLRNHFYELLSAILDPPAAKLVEVDWGKPIQFEGDGEGELENLGRIHMAVGRYNQAVYCKSEDKIYCSSNEGVTSVGRRIINTPESVELEHEVAVATKEDSFIALVRMKGANHAAAIKPHMGYAINSWNENGWAIGTWHKHTVKG